MTTRHFLHRLEYGAYSVIAGITQRLPLPALRAWGRAVGALAYRLLPRRRRLTLDNLARALPDLDAATRARIARLCFEVQSETYHEQVWAMRRGREIADRFEIVGREHFEAAHARGKGVFVLTGHYGCWELAGYPLGRRLGTLYIVARPQNNPFIAAHFESLRETNGNVQIDRARAGTRMLRVLKKGGAIGVAIDQRVRPAQGLLVPFLGRLAWTSRLPAYLATVTGCAAVPMVCEPLPDGRYRMTFDPPILPEGEGDDEIERLTRRYAAALEPWIRARPELWLWMHSRWQRTRKQRRPEAIARLVEEAHLPAAEPLDAVERTASPLRRLAELASDDFVENARHLVLGPSDRVAAADRSATAESISAAAMVTALLCTTAAAAFGRAIAGLGHATRYLTLEQVRDRLARARADGRLDGELRDLDQIPLLVIDAAGALPSATPIELLARLLAHRLERGSVVLAGASVARWRAAAQSATPASAALDAFFEAAEPIDVLGIDRGPHVAAPAVASDATVMTPRETAADTDAGAPALRA